MTILEGDGSFEGKAGKLRFRYQPSRSDRRHLTVVFSGHRARGTVDFEGAASNLRTAVIWIYDEFGPDSKVTYYLSDSGQNSPVELVSEFLSFAMQSLELSAHEISCIGFSKGASAALYFGLRSNVGSIIATVPPIWPGSAARKRSPDVFLGMINRQLDEDEETKRIDELIPDLIRSGAGASTATYVLTSETDPRYWEQVEPNLGLLKLLPGLTMFKYDSGVIRGHSDVTPYAIPTVMALLYLHADGFNPSFATSMASVQMHHESVAREQLRTHTGIARLNAIPFRDNRLFLEMDTLIRGYAVPDYGIMERSLELRSADGHKASFPLSTEKNSMLSRRYLSDTFVDYTACMSVTSQGLGIPLADIPLGKHDISVSLRSHSDKTIATEPRLLPASGLSLPRFYNTDQRIVSVRALRSGIELEALSPYEIAPSTDLIVRPALLTVTGTLLTIQGSFNLPGVTVENWGDATVRLVAERQGESQLLPLGLLDRPNWAPSPSLRKAAFGDIGGRGIDLSNLVGGLYDLRLLVMSSHRVAKSTVFACLSVSDAGVSAEQISSAAVDAASLS